MLSGCDAAGWALQVFLTHQIPDFRGHTYQVAGESFTPDKARKTSIGAEGAADRLVVLRDGVRILDTSPTQATAELIASVLR